MASQRILALAPVVGLALTLLGQTSPPTVPVPADPLELVTGPIQSADTPDARKAALDLLNRARNSYALRTGGIPYDLKVLFTVNSDKQTQYDGDWQMEETFMPGQLRWTATSTGGYTATSIMGGRHVYTHGTTNIMPLRLQQARSALFAPVATPNFTNGDLIRTSTAAFNGMQLTCVLLSGKNNSTSVISGRRWEESEECIDPQSGLLMVHSLAPGLYDLYDYANAPTLGAHKLPRGITITEGGKKVVTLEVQSLTAWTAPDPSQFKPNAQMVNEPGVAVAQARKASVFYASSAPTEGAVIHPVCVFGLITPSGQLVEAHSLQPSDPNSDAALQTAEHMDFRMPAPMAALPEQRFGFVIVKFLQQEQNPPAKEQ